MCRRSKLRIFRIVINGLYEDLNALSICLPKSLGSRSLIHRIYGFVRAFAGLLEKLPQCAAHIFEVKAREGLHPFPIGTMC